ncbi:uncharacterized protein LOC105690534 isoform X3 [Athalia rosae]|uniref:uncharacterized protein LOC105690534 isoform X3 n=1 Tax=Athalia rosae TaxID=37344 RepID=UPI002034129D|nr:uncharacterized protein LOC105690534 isoform X3 [Athalia rosae]
MYDVNLCKMSRRRSKRLSQNPDKLICHFCGCDEENEIKYGKLWNQDGIITHYYCLLLSSNMEQNGEDDQGILGFMPADIQKELRRGKKLSCCYCKRSGATLGCCHARCKRVFHLPCGLQAGSLHQFFGEFRSYCVTHRIQQKIDEHIKQEAAAAGTVICCICYDDVSPNNTIRTLWAPCCRKNAWFHRDCVQRLALSAGYFFKCPLCNNKQEFQQAMLDHGIFIPHQDASWELVPDAFQELLHRHNSCDAVECLCPKGRDHTSVNAKWELVLCQLCGSQGIHKACGNLKWSNSTWDCAQCANMLDKASDDSSAKNEATEETKLSTMPEDSDGDSDISVVGDSSPKPAIEDRYSPPPVILSGVIRPGPRSFKLKQAVQNVTSTESAASNISDTPLIEDRVQSPLNHPEHIADALSNETDDERSLTNNISGEIDITDKQPSSIEQNSEYLQANEPSPENTQTMKSSEQLPSEIISLDSDDEVEIINVPQLQNVLTTKNGMKIEIHNLPKLPAEFDKVEGDLNVIKSSPPRRIPSHHGLISTEKSDSSVNPFKNSTSRPTPNSDETSIHRTKLSVTRNADTIAVKLIENLDDSELIVSQPSEMNIKITNVTSLCPHVIPALPLIIKKKESISSKPHLLRIDLKNKSSHNDDQPIELVETANQIIEASNTSTNGFQPNATIGELGLKRKDKFFDHSDPVTGPLNDEVGLHNKKARISQSPKSPSALQNTDDGIHMLNDVGGSIPKNRTSLIPSTSHTKMCDSNQSQRKQHWSPADIKTSKSGVSSTPHNTDKNKEKNRLFGFSSFTGPTKSVKTVDNTNRRSVSLNGYSPIWPECHANGSESVSTTPPSHAQGGKTSKLRKILPKPNVQRTLRIDDNALFNLPQILETSDKLVRAQQTSEQHTSNHSKTGDSSSHPSSRSSEIINGEMSVRNKSKQTTPTSMFTSSSRFCCPISNNVLNTSSSIAQVADGLSITSGAPIVVLRPNLVFMERDQFRTMRQQNQSLANVNPVQNHKRNMKSVMIPAFVLRPILPTRNITSAPQPREEIVIDLD